MAEWQQRAIRFPLPLPLRYRISQASDWLSGRTENISGSGLVFAADREWPLGTEIEFLIALEADGGSYPSEVRARGQIVRILAPVSQSAGAAMAVKFARYEVVPRQVGQA
jgi:hypothetical protein